MFKNLLKIFATSLMFVMLLSVACYAEEDIEPVASEAAESITSEAVEVTSASAEDVAILATSAESTEEEKAEKASESVTTTSDSATTTGTSSEEVLRNDLYLIEGEVDCTQTIDGNAYIIGGEVSFSSVIGGDVYILGNNVTITENALIYGNLYVLANTLTIDGYVYGGDLYAACSQLVVSENAAINRDIRVAAGSIQFDGGLGRNFNASSSTITVGENAIIYGDFNYSTSEPIQIPSGVVKGAINFNETREDDNNTNPVLSHVINFAQFIVLMLAVLGVMVFLAPRFLNKVENTKTKGILPSLGFGLLGLIVAVPVAILLFMTIIGTSVGLSILSVWSFLVFNISTPVAVIAIAGAIARKVKVLSKGHNIFAVIITSILIMAIELIPFVGGFVSLLLVVYGLGLIMTTVWKNRKIEEAE